MLYLVIERFKNGDFRAVGARFRRQGRMMPPGVTYVGSWLTPDGRVCYQLTEAPDRAALDAWMDHWRDLVEFEVHVVEPSAEFWTRVNAIDATTESS